MQDANSIGAFEIDRAPIDVLDFADSFRRVQQINHRALKQRRHHLQETRVANDIAHDRPLAAPAEPAHPMLHVSEEALPRLLAVVSDIDPSLELLFDHVASRRLDLGHHRGVINFLPTALFHEHSNQPLPPRQATSMSSQNTPITSKHYRSSAS